MSDIIERAKEALDRDDIHGRTSIVIELISECQRLEFELGVSRKWRQIAIDERAKTVVLFLHPGADRAKIPELKREQAARELEAMN